MDKVNNLTHNISKTLCLLLIKYIFLSLYLFIKQKNKSNNFLIFDFLKK